ncbi:ER membrane protein complex subunit 1-like [Zingiber officinale]|uniref:ER membrane protein complex subunit 1-like n=1 Tax=Zingiber officinale TaxID=94328 RepID=UPI001C4B767E|nr:ER membrane protein complex subunit 1-like [Zingiber officinale]
MSPLEGDSVFADLLEPRPWTGMAIRACLRVFTLLLLSTFSSALYEDQVGLADWHQKYIGKVKHAVFHTQKTGRKRVVVSTEENVFASLDLRTGNIFWRHVLGKDDQIDQIDIALGKYVITLSSGGSILRAWNLPDGQIVWEAILQESTNTESFLYLPSNMNTGKDNLILVFGGSSIYAVSSIDGQVVWRKEFSVNDLAIQHVSRSQDSDTIYALGFVGSSEFTAYHISYKTGEVLQQIRNSYKGGFCGEASLVFEDMIVALDASRSALISISFKNGIIEFHQMHFVDLVPEFVGKARLLPPKLNGMLAISTSSSIILLRVKGINQLEVAEKTNHPSVIISNALSLSKEQEAFAMLQHDGSRISLKVKFNNDLTNEILKETLQLDSHRGNVEKAFINIYTRTDRTHGFRVLVIMEDHSLLLVQQGEIVWSREDGLASIVESTTSELPVEKEGVSVARVEHNLFEWLKGHFLKIKGTLMLATPQEVAEIQAIRLKSSQKSKMTRDHNGFRKLIIVLTRAGKVLALHTGDGRVVWSVLLSTYHRSETCRNPAALSLLQWQIPHHHAMHENPSVLVAGRCGHSSDAPGFFSIIDSYTGKVQKSLMLEHSVRQIMPLPLTDSTEQRLHLIIDANLDAHLYPRTSECLKIFHHEIPNTYWYLVDKEQNIIRGYSLESTENEFVFRANELWSIIIPSESEKIVATATRKMNEIVHTQAKVTADQDVMYKYVSKNILFVATVTPRAAGYIGSAAPEEAWLFAYLIDTVSGRILHRVSHHGAQGPVHAVMSENWVVYHYFNLRAHRYEMSVIEIYDQSRSDNRDVWKLVLGKHNLTAPISSYTRPDVIVKSQSYFFTHSVKSMAVTSTAKGITSKQLLIGTVSDQVLALDKRFLDPRRSANPTPAEKEEGIIPLTDSLPIIPQSYATHSLQVEGLRNIVTVPAKLESTTLVFCYGVDLFFTRIAPSRTYDSLTEDFSYALLLITIVALVVAIFVTWFLSEKKELREKWR